MSQEGKSFVNYDVKLIVDIFFEHFEHKQFSFTKDEYYAVLKVFIPEIKIKDDVITHAPFLKHKVCWSKSGMMPLTKELLTTYLKTAINSPSNVETNVMNNRVSRASMILEKDNQWYNCICLGNYIDDANIIPSLTPFTINIKEAETIKMNVLCKETITGNSYYIHELNRYPNEIISVNDLGRHIIIHSNGFVYLKIKLLKKFIIIDYTHNFTRTKVTLNTSYQVTHLINKVNGTYIGKQILTNSLHPWNNGDNSVSTNNFISIKYDAVSQRICKNLVIEANDYYNYEYNLPIFGLGLYNILDKNATHFTTMASKLYNNKKQNKDLIISIDCVHLNQLILDTIVDYTIVKKENIIDYILNILDDYIVGKCKIEIRLNTEVQYIENKNFNSDCNLDSMQEIYTNDKDECIGKGRITEINGNPRYLIERCYSNGTEISFSKINKISKHLFKVLPLKPLIKIILDYLY